MAVNLFSEGISIFVILAATWSIFEQNPNLTLTHLYPISLQKPLKALNSHYKSTSTPQYLHVDGKAPEEDVLPTDDDVSNSPT